MAEGEAGYGYPPDEIKHHIRVHLGCNELLSGLLLSTLDSFFSDLRSLFSLFLLLQAARERSGDSMSGDLRTRQLHDTCPTEKGPVLFAESTQIRDCLSVM